VVLATNSRHAEAYRGRESSWVIRSPSTACSGRTCCPSYHAGCPGHLEHDRGQAAERPSTCCAPAVRAPS